MQKNCLNYPVEFVEDAFGDSTVLSDTLKAVTGSERPKVQLIADYNVVQRVQGLGAKIGRYVQAHGIELAGSPVVMAGGEKIKADSLQSVLKVVMALLEAKLGKNDAVVAIGGGTLLDVAGYAAAQTRGGVKFVRVPTTPAAMIDAAFAERAAVDCAVVKDALSVAAPPSAVVIDTGFAASVLDGVWRGGISEAVRLAVVASAPFVKKLAGWAESYRTRDLGTLREIVRTAYDVRVKKGGTTLADWAAARLESMSGYKLPHGYAMSIGVCVDLAYAEEKGFVKPAERALVMKTLTDCGALDGLLHSQHLLRQEDDLLLGLDAWRLRNGSPAIELPAGIGKSGREEMPDREVYRKVFKALVG